jgi:hypothetical protein
MAKTDCRSLVEGGSNSPCKMRVLENVICITSTFILVLVLPLIAFRNPSECNNIMYYDVQVRHSCSSPLLAFRNPSENRKIIILSYCCLRTASDSLYSALNTISTTTIRGGPTNLHLLELSYSTYANFRIFYKIQTLKLKKATWPRPLFYLLYMANQISKEPSCAEMEPQERL